MRKKQKPPVLPAKNVSVVNLSKIKKRELKSEISNKNLGVLGEHVEGLVKSTLSSIDSAVFAFKTISEAENLETLNANLLVWAFEQLEVTTQNNSIFKDFATEYALFDKHLSQVNNSLHRLAFLARAFNETHKAIIEEADDLNLKYKMDIYDKSICTAVLEELVKKHDTLDTDIPEQNRVATAHDELTAKWPFDQRNLGTINVLKALKTETGDKMLALYETRGPPTVKHFCFSAAFLTAPSSGVKRFTCNGQ